jgi:hypothetical protein
MPRGRPRKSSNDFALKVFIASFFILLFTYSIWSPLVTSVLQNLVPASIPITEIETSPIQIASADEKTCAIKVMYPTGYLVDLYAKFYLVSSGSYIVKETATATPDGNTFYASSFDNTIDYATGVFYKYYPELKTNPLGASAGKSVWVYFKPKPPPSVNEFSSYVEKVFPAVPKPDVGKQNIVFKVYDKDTGAPISGATVSGYGGTKTTDLNGYAVFLNVIYFSYGWYTVTKDGYNYTRVGIPGIVNEIQAVEVPLGKVPPPPEQPPAVPPDVNTNITLSLTHVIQLEGGGFGAFGKLSYKSGDVWLPLSGEYVDVYYKPASGGDWVKAGSSLTNTKGEYSVTLRINSKGSYIIMAKFSGDKTLEKNYLPCEAYSRIDIWGNNPVEPPPSYGNQTPPSQTVFALSGKITVEFLDSNNNVVYSSTSTINIPLAMAFEQNAAKIRIKFNGVFTASETYPTKTSMAKLVLVPSINSTIKLAPTEVNVTYWYEGSSNIDYSAEIPAGDLLKISRLGTNVYEIDAHYVLYDNQTKIKESNAVLTTFRAGVVATSSGSSSGTSGGTTGGSSSGSGGGQITPPFDISNYLVPIVATGVIAVAVTLAARNLIKKDKRGRKKQ